MQDGTYGHFLEVGKAIWTDAEVAVLPIWTESFLSMRVKADSTKHYRYRKEKIQTDELHWPPHSQPLGIMFENIGEGTS